jgi:hypothetical protein
LILVPVSFQIFGRENFLNNKIIIKLKMIGVKKILRFLNSIRKVTIVLACLFFLGISCSKEYSAEGPAPWGPVSLFSTQIPAGQTENDGTGGIELGLRFRSTVPGYIEGIKFYKTPGNTGTHTAQLYSFDGILLASEVFINETDSGWQSVLFTTPVPIAANTTYIAAYHSSAGNYISTPYVFNTAVTNGPLIGLADGADGINGLYKYSSSPAFPDLGHLSNNYWVDILESDNQIE